MVREILYLFAMQMRKRAAVRAADVKMAFLTGVILELRRSAAVMRNVFAQPSALAKTGDDAVHRGFANIHSAFDESTVRFIGSTTENPLISMTPAIVSRCRIFQFEPLKEADVLSAMRRA